MESDRPDTAEALERARVDAHELSWLLRLSHRAAEELDRSLAGRMSLRPLDYDAMGAIMDSEADPIGPVELAQRLGISAGSATELVDRLEHSGHVARERSTRDRRRVHVVAAERTVSRLLGELAPLFGDLDRYAESFTAEEQLVIARFLRGSTDLVVEHAARLARPEHDDLADPAAGEVATP